MTRGWGGVRIKQWFNLVEESESLMTKCTKWIGPAGSRAFFLCSIECLQVAVLNSAMVRNKLLLHIPLNRDQSSRQKEKVKSMFPFLPFLPSIKSNTTNIDVWDWGVFVIVLILIKGKSRERKTWKFWGILFFSFLEWQMILVKDKKVW